MKITERKLVFDIEGKPELAEAIKARLVELGFSIRGDSPTRRFFNISTGRYGDHDEAAMGCCSIYHRFYADHTLATLSDLYDPEFIGETEMEERYLVQQEEFSPSEFDSLSDARDCAERQVLKYPKASATVYKVIATVKAKTEVEWDE